jgi:starch phosphorylase
MSRMSLIEECGRKYIRMANLAIVGSHSVNGVSALHSQLLKDMLFKDFYQLWPTKFNNKTNGITPRRWLLKANKRLSKLITDTTSSAWIRDLDQLKKLSSRKDDATFQKQWQAIKRANKEDFSAYVKMTTGIVLNPDSMFDVQIKRIHEYKRQMLFAFYVLREYLKIKNDPKAFIHPRTFVFGGKAAPGYRMAKQIIRFINSIGFVINNDRMIGDKLKVVFLENYRVSLAEKVFPASDLSEQISLAGYEASGTGCMKFMVNGALTIGTHDGANIEMGEEVGADNFYFFGLKADAVESAKVAGYSPQSYINRNFYLQEIFRLIDLNFFSPLETGIFRDLADNLRYKDPYLVCADFEDYCRVQDIASEEYKNTKLWTRKSILNTACSGMFSSDRTIREYATDIWGVSTK